jgi:preprotein translocase subunit SecE
MHCTQNRGIKFQAVNITIIVVIIVIFFSFLLLWY